MWYGSEAAGAYQYLDWVSEDRLDEVWYEPFCPSRVGDVFFA